MTAKNVTGSNSVELAGAGPAGGLSPGGPGPGLTGTELNVTVTVTPGPGPGRAMTMLGPVLRVRVNHGEGRRRGPARAKSAAVDSDRLGFRLGRSRSRLFTDRLG